MQVLVDGDSVISESAAIVLYLAEKYPDKGLLPTDLKERAQVYRWVLFAMTDLEQPLWRIATHTSSNAPGGVACGDFAAMARVLERHMDGQLSSATASPSPTPWRP